MLSSFGLFMKHQVVSRIAAAGGCYVYSNPSTSNTILAAAPVVAVVVIMRESGEVQHVNYRAS